MTFQPRHPMRNPTDELRDRLDAIRCVLSLLSEDEAFQASSAVEADVAEIETRARRLITPAVQADPGRWNNFVAELCEDGYEVVQDENGRSRVVYTTTQQAVIDHVQYAERGGVQ